MHTEAKSRPTAPPRANLAGGRLCRQSASSAAGRAQLRTKSRRHPPTSCGAEAHCAREFDPATGASHSKEENFVTRSRWSTSSRRVSTLINELPGTAIDLELTGEAKGYMVVLDPGGRRLLVRSKDKGEAATDSLVIETHEPHFVIVHQFGVGPGNLKLTSSHLLVYLHDPDDGRRVRVGETVKASIDFPGDWDYFLLDLSKEETVEVANTSPVLDLVLTFYALDRDGQIDFGAVDTELLHVGDSSTGYRAPRTGSYLLWAYGTLRAPPDTSLD